MPQVTAGTATQKRIDELPLTTTAWAQEQMDRELDREYLLLTRQGLLAQVDAIERRLGISPTTAEVRKAEKKRAHELENCDIIDR